MILIYRFCNWEVSSSYEYKLQLPSAALSIPISPSPQLPSSPLYPQLPISPTPQQPSLSPAPQLSPTPQVPSPGGPEAVDAVVPAGSRWCCTSSMVTTLLCCTTESTCCPLCPTGVLVDPVAAVLWKLIGCSFVLRRLKLIAAVKSISE